MAGGTFYDSKVVTARKDHICDVKGCNIPKGDQYLNFKPGLMSVVKVCIDCATTTMSGEGEMRIHRYDCLALRELLAEDQSVAGNW